MKKPLAGWILLCILSTATLCFGQLATTSLRGTIKDPSGALVPGAKVTLTDKATGKTISAMADNAGQYAFAQIAPSHYNITVAAVGFGEQTKSAELLVNQPATIDFALTVQSSTVTVDVSAEAQTLNTSDASLGNSANNELIQALPSETRNVPDLLSLQPGVLYLPNSSDSRTGAVNGGRADQGNVTIDGVDDNDQVNGYAFQGVLRETQDSIEEFRVTTSNANADAGRSSGAQVSMVTKSGTNKFHGAAYEYYRPPLTAANNWFNKQAQVNEGLPNVPTKVLRNIFGASFGGPIKKDKLFFFGNFEATRQAEDAQEVRTVATSSYAAGNLTFVDANGNVQTLSSAAVTALDANCQICNSPDYPNPPGPNPNSLAYFNSMPKANGTLTGDGYNRGSFSFASPNPVRNNTSIARLDFTPNDRHRIFVRGNLQKDTVLQPEQFPGQGPSSTDKSNNKGIVFGDTWTITSNLINDIRYGYVRQGNSATGVGKGDYVDFRFMDSPTAETRSTFTTVPVNNIVDNLSWTKSKHSIQLGGNWRLIHQNHRSDSTTWQHATTNPYWLGGNPPSPAAGVSDGFANSYEIAFANLVGTVPELDNSFNYHVDSATTGTLLADGSFLNRHFKANEFEWYIQDAWRIKPNLTLTFGVRHTLLQTPYESSGQQVAPTIDTHSWYLQRESAALKGQVYEPDMQFSPSGPNYGKPGFWPKSKNNFAPRLSVAYSPDSKTSIRAGAGIYYDHYGESLVNIFDREGSFGISSSVTNSAGVYGIEGNAKHPPSPRFTGRNTLPNIDNGGAAQTQTYPFTAPQGNFAITWGLDNKLKTPYSESLDFSIQRQTVGGFTIEASYVGRLGRHLLQNLDLTEPVDFVDPQGGGDYYAAGTALSKAVDQNGGAASVTYDDNGNAVSYPAVSTIPYFEDIFPFMKDFDFVGESATQAIYNYEWAPYRAQYGATTALADLDFFCVYLSSAQCSNYQSKFWQDQFSSLYALSTIGRSSYHAGQITLRHPMSHGLQFDFSYTMSKSIDWGSDAERDTEFTGEYNFDNIINTWKPYLNRGVSAFDTKHLITADWVYQLPFGRGRQVLGNSSTLLDTFIGGWQWSGINRWSSGLPFSVFEPGWSTDWQIESYGVNVGNAKIHKHIDKNGNPQFFGDAAGINAGTSTGGPIRLPYPGETGQRNNFRGDGYFNIDSGLAKTWKIREFGTLKFAWEVYNVTNAVRFDPKSIDNGLTNGSLGIASSLLTAPRRQQFSLRYDF
ncbi:TonB-dependent receptor [Occallatibacter savannae]|uniref:TonB-dependent receptor n=1 Tax=Occallatibacter savannae TaxID=1002691 RepID=UPI000D6992A3|nr:TonB-dependent receptor [Occallatibacter savannae]